MANFRQIHVSIWKDGWFLELEPDEKLLFIYLFSNESASLSGIYRLARKVMAFETGIARERIDEILNKFEADDKVHTHADVVWVVNMRRFHATRSPKVQKMISSDLDLIPDNELKRKYLAYYQAKQTYPASSDTLSIPYRYPMDTDQYPMDTDLLKDKIRKDKIKKEEEEENRARARAGAISQQEKTTTSSASAFEDQKSSFSSPISTAAAIAAWQEAPEEAWAQRVYSLVTGFVAFPSDIREEAIRIILALRSASPNERDLATYLLPFYRQWTQRKGKNGLPYSRGGLGWLDWALAGEVPAAAPQRQNSRPEVGTPEEYAAARQQLAEHRKKRAEEEARAAELKLPMPGAETAPGTPSRMPL